MPDDPYSLADLSRLADVTPRTIRYYVAQGLLPSPGAAGPATRYGDGHLARLRLIKRLQREHLPLAEIRARLERMGDEEVQGTLDASGPATVEPPMGTDATLAFVRDLMTKAGVAPRFYEQPAEPPVPMHLARHALLAIPVRPASAEPTVDEASDEPGLPSAPAQPGAPALPVAPATPPSAPVAAAPLSRSTAGDRSTWERHSITPDVELHVRRPLDRATNKRVERLARIARELFEEDA